MDTASGYRPLVNLLYDQAIPRKYKDIGLTKWFDIAEQEEKGITQPREEHERAIKNMAEFVQAWTHGENVDDDTHTKVVAFLESNIPTGSAYIADFAVSRVAEHIKNEDIRFDFARRHIFIGSAEESAHFQIRDDRDLALVDWVREEAHKRELPQLIARADALVELYQAERQERLAKQAAELALQERLRA